MRGLALTLSLLLAGCGTLGNTVELTPPARKLAAQAPLNPHEPAAEEYPERSKQEPGTPSAMPRKRSIADALSPGWSIRELDLGDKRYHLSLELDGLHTGGDGDVRRIVARRAAAMARRQGLAGYEILKLEEGVRSGWLWGKRVAEAEYRLFESGAWPAM